jgi:hypothetical protein
MTVTMAMTVSVTMSVMMAVTVMMTGTTMNGWGYSTFTKDDVNVSNITPCFTMNVATSGTVTMTMWSWLHVLQVVGKRMGWGGTSVENWVRVTVMVTVAMIVIVDND